MGELLKLFSIDFRVGIDTIAMLGSRRASYSPILQLSSLNEK